MNILILNGSPRPNGNTSAMVDAFVAGAKENHHNISVVPICQKKIAGCIACEYCHTKGGGKCVQQDDMQEVYPLLESADMIVLASPVYYHSFTGQLQCAINRIYALDELVGGNKILFSATGVTGGDLVKGIQQVANGVRTQTLLIGGADRTCNIIDSLHSW